MKAKGPARVAMRAGETRAMEIEGALGPMSYASTNPAVAEIGPDGKLRAKRPGVAVVRASDGAGAAAVFAVVVAPGPPPAGKG